MTKTRPPNPNKVVVTCGECGANGEPFDVFDNQHCHNPDCNPPKVGGMSALARKHAEKQQ